MSILKIEILQGSDSSLLLSAYPRSPPLYRSFSFNLISSFSQFSSKMSSPFWAVDPFFLACHISSATTAVISAIIIIDSKDANHGCGTATGVVLSLSLPLVAFEEEGSRRCLNIARSRRGRIAYVLPIGGLN